MLLLPPPRDNVARNNADRSKAKRIRKKGANASDEEKKWLAEYEAPKPSQIGSDNTLAGEVEIPLDEEMGTDAGEPTNAPNQPADDTPVLEPDHISAKPDVGRPGGTQCGIPNCPKCAKAEGRRAGQVCSVTGEVVFPPLSDGTARLFTSLIFFVVAVAVASQTKKKAPPPTEREMNEFAEPLKEVLYEEMNFLGAYDAPMRLVAALTGYYMRAKAQAE